MTGRGNFPAARLAVALLVLVSGSFLACDKAAESPPVEAPTVPDVAVVPPDSDDAAAETTPMRVQVVEIYFPSAEDDGLVAEAREIFVTSAPGDRAKQIIADLISGPMTELALRALPRGTRLRQVYVLDHGVAYADFSEDLREGLGGGSAEELLAVYSIVDSVILNVVEIERVGILINGQPVDTLNGHMDLRRPLGPDISLIVGRIASTEPAFDQSKVAHAIRPTDETARR